MSVSGAATTEITLTSGERYLVSGEAKQIERLVLDAARGSLMQFAWLTEVDTGADLAINPAAVMMLRSGR